MEDELDDISNGKRNGSGPGAFWKPFSAHDRGKGIRLAQGVTQEQMDEIPEVGKHNLTLRLGRRGAHRCAGYRLRLHAQLAARERRGGRSARLASIPHPQVIQLLQALRPYISWASRGRKKPSACAAEERRPDAESNRVELWHSARPGAAPRRKKSAAIGRFGP